MNIVGKLSLACLVLFAAQAMCSDSASIDQQSNGAAVEKIARAVYKTIDNQKWLTAFLLTVPYIQIWIAPGTYSNLLFTHLFGGKVLLDEFTEQMKANFEGIEPKAWSKGTFLTFLAMLYVELKISERVANSYYY
jgi:hypothetical protein